MTLLCAWSSPIHRCEPSGEVQPGPGSPREHARRHELVLRRPLEHPANDCDCLVDGLAAPPAAVDHVLANGLERQRPEVLRQRVVVDLGERLQGILDVLKRRGLLAVLDVVPLGKVRVSVDEGRNRVTARSAGCGRVLTPGDLPVVNLCFTTRTGFEPTTLENAKVSICR
jgi:hypothetical protein